MSLAINADDTDEYKMYSEVRADGQLKKFFSLNYALNSSSADYVVTINADPKKTEYRVTLSLLRTLTMVNFGYRSNANVAYGATIGTLEDKRTDKYIDYTNKYIFSDKTTLVGGFYQRHWSNYFLLSGGVLGSLSPMLEQVYLTVRPSLETYVYKNFLVGFDLTTIQIPIHIKNDPWKKIETYSKDTYRIFFPMVRVGYMF